MGQKRHRETYPRPRPPHQDPRGGLHTHHRAPAA
ncbi:hypothetical protein CRUP_024047 [Coryphaenoides rupestris]|nr:hypothetical protein CRUP_024047 [Coryphaenoides rupestris]